MDDGYRRLLHLALATGRRWSASSAASVVAAALIFPTLPTEFSTQTDEGQVQVNVELAQGTRIEVTDPVLPRVEAADHAARARSDRRSSSTPAAAAASAAAARRRRRACNRGNISILLTPKDERTRSSEQIAHGSAPAAVGHSRRRSSAPTPSGGNNQLNRFLSGGGNNGGGRLSLEIRGERPRRRRRSSPRPPRTCSTRCRASPTRASGATKAARSWRCASTARRPRCSASAPRRSRTRSAPTSPARRRRMFREAGNEYPIIVRLREDERQDVDRRRRRAGQHAAAGRCMPAKNLMRVENAVGPIADPAQEPAAHHLRERRAGNDAERGGRGGAGAAAAAARHACRRTSASASAPKSSSRPRRSTSCGWC